MKGKRAKRPLGAVEWPLGRRIVHRLAKAARDRQAARERLERGLDDLARLREKGMTDDQTT